LYFYQRIVSLENVSPAPVAIVFGAGVNKVGEPSAVLHDRLEVAAQLYDAQKVERILVSGDNSTTDYDEPTNMMRYLVDEKHIPREDVFIDFAGRRTYDTCIRAHNIWGIDRAILVTQEYHLSRALMTCSVVGVDAYGVAADLQPYDRIAQYRFREVFAFVQAMIDVSIWPPHYIGGAPEEDLDP
jgi:vancomycin permeability regulator SanA